MDQVGEGASAGAGNVVALEHVNVRVPDQRMAMRFYGDGIGFRRDPEYMTGDDNMWMNLGRTQFHLPTGKAQVLRGHVGLVLPDREALLRNLAKVSDDLKGTSFAFVENTGSVEVCSPWGNRLRCFDADSCITDMPPGLAYVEFDVPVSTSAAIARFYDEILGANTDTGVDERGRFACCSVGNHQSFVFRETDRQPPEYDGHHVQIYLTDIAGPRSKLEALGLVYDASGPTQYRFKDITDLGSGEVLFTVEHEIRSTDHPFYSRQLFDGAS